MTSTAAIETFTPVPSASPAPFETEQVREFQPREVARPAPMHEPVPAPAASFAPAVPIRIEMPTDLQQVESDPGKIRSVQQEAVQEAPAPRPKRVRPARAPMAEEPLVQIETGGPDAPQGSGEKTPA